MKFGIFYEHQLPRPWGQRKREELAPYVAAAMARKQAMRPLRDDEIPVYEAYGNTVALTDEDIKKMPEGNRRRVLTFRRIKEIAERARAVPGG